ncbi:thioesterase [Pedobacter lusitanus]|uniref:Thioesterase n=1 Tax=Pedobacter lusitanus TaxID=1503925 RepID=A0A0D0G2B1_9SPHI|nr:PaaI family thioesterase [Pedobacter lusitanus]KIO78919.1 thioesterase [Pedobacter lusitanus]
MKNDTTQIRQGLIAQLGKTVTNSPSAFMLWLAPVVREIEEGSMTFDYQVRKEMTNPIGTLHGGVTAAIMDDMIGATIISLGREHFYTTVNNVIDYFSTAKIGDTITGKTKIIKAGRQIINVQFELWNMDKERLLARGYSNALKTDHKINEAESIK